MNKILNRIVEDRSALLLIGALVVSSFAFDVNAADTSDVESVTIIGSKDDVKDLAGSGAVISNEDLQKAMDTDIAKILSAVPGMFMRTEEGYGLRPNISIRGTAIERSGKVTIMEDGVLVAPSPYTSSAAYYFPTTGRIHAVEVLKGPAAVSQGPQTIGGAINLISTPIPEVNSGKFVQELGQNGMSRTHAYYGATQGAFGALVEVHEHSSDGFDKIAHVGGDTGFDKSDLMLKARYESGNHSLTFKMVDIDETSNQSYVGLSQSSFMSNARLRYMATAYDKMMNDGEQTSLTYVGDFDNFDVVFTSWSNDYHRDWFKVSDFNNDSEHGQRDDINELISDANNGSANAQAILDGELPVEIEYKHNNRYYTNEGYQFNVSTDIGIHALTLGYRDMEDSESRVQAYEYADQSAKSLSALYGYRGLGGSNNRLRESSATSYYLEDTMDFGKLAVTVGYRSEDYDQRHRRWDEGAGPNLTAVRETIVRDTFAANDHTTSSLGATYELNENMVLVAGFHQGMTPMFGADPEEADNTEFGVRYSEGSTNIEAFYFSSEYSNLAAECTLVSGASCDANESAVFSGGAADVSGLELSGSWIFEGDNGVTYPIAVTYTSTDSEFLNSSDSDYFGTVAAGDSLPYIPDSQMSLVAGFITDNGLSGNMRLVSVGSSCSLAACGTYNQIEEHSYVDLNLRKAVTETVNVYMIMENVFDSEDIISRAPSEGARSQKPATLKVGFSMNF